MRRSQWFIVLVMLLDIRCISSYAPPEIKANLNYLVVDGFLDKSSNTCAVKLTRTVPISGGLSTLPVVLDATVQLEDDANTLAVLKGDGTGTYLASGLNIDNTKKYRLKIKTADAKEYESDFVPVIQTPAIDSVGWNITLDGMQLYVNTHGGNDNSRYYLWNFIETWEYRSAQKSDWRFDDSTKEKIVPRDTSDNLYRCWQTAYSNEILVGSTAQLSDNVVSEFQLEVLPLTSEKTRFRYSIEVNQRALTQEAFEYWVLLKKNSENLGTLFDALPSQIFGNLRCTTNASEPVIGYFSAGNATKKRIFVNAIDLPFVLHDTGYEYCHLDTLFLKDIPLFKALSKKYLIGGTIHVGDPLVGYAISTNDCIDCRLHGGVNAPPSFWK